MDKSLTIILVEIISRNNLISSLIVKRYLKPLYEHSWTHVCARARTHTVLYYYMHTP